LIQAEDHSRCPGSPSAVLHRLAIHQGQAINQEGLRAVHRGTVVRDLTLALREGDLVMEDLLPLEVCVGQAQKGEEEDDGQHDVSSVGNVEIDLDRTDRIS
jgi:hypothetical protein